MEHYKEQRKPKWRVLKIVWELFIAALLVLNLLGSESYHAFLRSMLNDGFIMVTNNQVIMDQKLDSINYNMCKQSHI